MDGVHAGNAGAISGDWYASNEEPASLPDIPREHVP
jgi:hypothetical protein